MWIIATAIGLGVGLATGAELVSYKTDITSLATMGAVCGLAVGIAQGATLRNATRMLGWTAVNAALWALGWTVTTAGGIDVSQQWAVFGAYGCFTLAFLQSTIVGAFVPAEGGDRMMSSLASLVVRRRRAVIILWFAVLIGAGAIGSSAFSVLSSSFGAGPSTESGRVTERLDALADTGGEIAIIADGVDVDDPAVAAAVGAGLARIAAIDGVIAVVDPWSTGSDALRASDGRAALAVVTITGGLEEEAELELAHEITDVAGTTRRPRGARRRQRARGGAVRHGVRERPAPRRGDRTANRVPGDDLPARWARGRRACRCSSRSPVSSPRSPCLSVRS